jgi:hypothetical protein
MAENRLTRELENRESGLRKLAWAPPQVLPSPKEQPGWVFRWIRTSLMGTSDPTNTSSKFREGWEPCKAEDHPELMLQADPNSRFKGNVEIGGLLLCKAPEEMMKQRDNFYLKQAQAQMEAVDNNFMRQKDDRSNMAIFNERKSGVSFGRGGK